MEPIVLACLGSTDFARGPTDDVLTGDDLLSAEIGRPKLGILPRVGEPEPRLSAAVVRTGEARRSVDRSLRSADARRSGWRQGSFPVGRHGSLEFGRFSLMGPRRCGLWPSVKSIPGLTGLDCRGGL